MRWETDFGAAQLSHINLYDKTVEGLTLLDVPGGTVQYRSPSDDTASCTFDIGRTHDIVEHVRRVSAVRFANPANERRCWLAMAASQFCLWNPYSQEYIFNPAEGDYRGAAFGLHVGPYSRWVFFAVAVIAVFVLNRMSHTSPTGDRFRQLALGLVAGGAAGNLIDRVRSARGVVDFLDVGIGALRWPTFNVADIAVSCGGIALAIVLWREDQRRAETESAPAA